MLREKLSLLPSLGAVHGRTPYDWGGTLENALKSEDIASAVAIAPRVDFSYAHSEGTRRAVKVYIVIRLLEAAQSRELLNAFPKVEERFREIIGNIRLEVVNAGTNPQFKLDSRVVKREDGTTDRTQPIDLYDFKSTLEWTLREFEPVLTAGNAVENPVVKRLKMLRDRLAMLSRSSLAGYEQLTLPYFTNESDRARDKAQITRAVEIISVSKGGNDAAEYCEKLCQVEQALLAELTSLPPTPRLAESALAKAV